MSDVTVTLSKTQQAILSLLAQSPNGIDEIRLINMLYMADIVSRQYLGHPITDIDWYRGPDGAVSLIRAAVSPGAGESIDVHFPDATLRVSREDVMALRAFDLIYFEHNQGNRRLHGYRGITASIAAACIRALVPGPGPVASGDMSGDLAPKPAQDPAPTVSGGNPA